MDRAKAATWIVVLIPMLLGSTLTARIAAEPVRTEVVVGEEYDRGCLYRGIFGEGYRDLWTAPIEVEVLHLSQAGLTVEKQVGSMQTLGLALVDGEGRSYTFRSIDKDASRLLPFWMRLPPWPGIFKDQTSAGFPGAPLVVERFAKALGSLETPLRLVQLADDPSLGDFREAFAGAVGTFREYPTAGDGTGRSGTFGALEILSTAALFERFLENGVDRPDARAYLRVRLLDIWVGDWDRHPEQLRWAKLPDSDLWQPLPEDRDGAFARYAGPVVNLFDIEQLVFFDHEYPDEDGLFLQARNLDAWVLAELDRETWEREIAFVKARIDSNAVDEAIERLPRTWQELRGDFLRERLATRRANLREQALRLYAYVAREARWIGSRQGEVWRVVCEAEGHLTLQRRPAESDDFVSRRDFNPQETQRVEVWTMGGDDREEWVDPHHCGPELVFRRIEDGDRLPKRVRGVPNWD